MIPTRLYIHYPDGIHQYGLCLESDNKIVSDSFIQQCHEHLVYDKRVNQVLGPFWQSGHFPNSTWFYFEMLKMVSTPSKIQEDIFIEVCELIAVNINLQLEF